MGISLTSLAAPDAAAWLTERVTGTLRTDSRHVQPGDAFVAWPGHVRDGRDFVADVLARGASACLIEAEGATAFGFDDPRIAQVVGLKGATGAIADQFFNHPSQRLSVVATTGTNGKTSTAWWMAQALRGLGQRCGLIGTLGVGEPPPGEVIATGLTTPDPVVLHAALHRFAAQGFAATAIEASSIGIEEERLNAVQVRVALFTNFTPDHLDYHATMAAYWAAKRRLFGWPGLQAAVINIDDPHGALLAQEQLGCAIWTYAVDQPARLRATDVTYTDGGLSFGVLETLPSGGTDLVPMHTRLIGAFNVANVLAVIGGLRALGVPLAQACAHVAHVTPVPGRMQRVQPGTGPMNTVLPQVVVDYAHTPDALDKALQALRPFAQARGGRLWCVFGCGGNRDTTKRPVMGALATRLADQVVLTSDNPRHESPDAILDQIEAGCGPQRPAHVRRLSDRRAAIALALAEAAPADVLLIAGKGHEDYQEVAGQRQPFSDIDEAARALQAWREPMFTLAEAQALIPGSVLVAAHPGAAESVVLRVHTDTRSLKAGDLFVALRGERWDAHDFLVTAREAGAAAALAERGLAEAGLSGLLVPDSLKALQTLATAWRARFAIPLIAVTGSNGKTTVTQMIASILRAWAGEAALATSGNLNNHIGVPLTLLRLRPSHRVAVVELGMNHPGEIAELAAMAQPTVALVNNAQREHQEFMKTVAAVAEENGAVLQALPADGVAVFPAGDAFTPLWQALAGPRRIACFGLDEAASEASSAQWQGTHWRVQMGLLDWRLHVAGLHNVRNALAAATCALAAGAPASAVMAGLDAFEPVKGRSQLSQLRLPTSAETTQERTQERVITLIDDTYNANPDSVRAAIDVLAALPGPRWLLLGDMGEVGDQGPAFHAEIGAYARACGIEQLWTAGTLAQASAEAFGAAARHHADTVALVGALRAVPTHSLPLASAVLVKGSRFMKMEQAVAALRDHGAEGSVHAG
ncbi:MAG: bifunctional UDP-N-acetylmuramoyl-L-alanyl-D-glutamate--2,6-diaminopimelate ligase MurE/UDP-N-acetylmuramoyl-tripeptide--D-alanyl-D-alanine ligase MurF [Leptothrix ochracea]|uniref:bifunctional UDP-N-acetylmuramoyl-L-alanyl-D-glutamate--2, 6-diaminopimelate ligase MurE/UDP-N-acetylmuramoyl-tripeptide--D-alanyl-D-alanine ligase MurF n=1 Tax=Leptothrix ochracea TaxID=735331 RepID=UPI0034E24881